MAAQTWQKVLYKDENTGASDVEIDPSNPDVLYACLWQARQGPWEDKNDYGGAAGGIFKSTDGGDTWNQLAGGLPDGSAAGLRCHRAQQSAAALFQSGHAPTSDRHLPLG